MGLCNQYNLALITTPPSSCMTQNQLLLPTVKVLGKHPHVVCVVSAVCQAELQRSLQASENSAAEAKEALSVKETELRDLRSQKAVEQGLVSKEDHESQRLSLQAEINAFTAQFNNLTRNHQKTCTEVCVLYLFLFTKIQRILTKLETETLTQELTTSHMLLTTHWTDVHQGFLSPSISYVCVLYSSSLPLFLSWPLTCSPSSPCLYLSSLPPLSPDSLPTGVPGAA